MNAKPGLTLLGDLVNLTPEISTLYCFQLQLNFLSVV